MNRPYVGILNYGIGNHASVHQGLKKLGCKVEISSKKDIVDRADLLVLPGVGAFPFAMAQICRTGVDVALKKRSESQRPILGICLGMQLLFSSSTEKKVTSGLNLIKGDVIPLNNPGLHVGWNSVSMIKHIPHLEKFEDQEFYFNHSFIVDTATHYQIATARHGIEFPVIVKKENTIGVQFHPEKSQGNGMEMLASILDVYKLA